ncbi:hypothetical protein AUK04_03700 [Candidatus Roizmanbacteria bacterium CG2_30_33_16]|uniref:AAA+ ATPase domain-containing protein n=3 Tax=Candidatus Roizmaniibacteriota TaxID=1752723 RepID=A0A1J5HMV2_9BACT|nr:MAG: hypothetical protein AUK04_03700 [Candidatus Roizmanbacteria bacterium CG2_30_33_16]
MQISRLIQKDIINHLQPNKVVVIYGPRRVGKTTLIQEINKKFFNKTLFVNGDDISIQSYLGSQNLEKLKSFVGKTPLLIIDEAQTIPKIGLNLKIMVDNIPNLKIIATGSASFDLSQQIGEPLVGRKWQFELYPISQLELLKYENPFESTTKLESRLIYGSYPEVVTASSNIKKGEILKEILDGYLFKDILLFEGLRKSAKLVQILKLIAFQIGREVSLRELAQHTELNSATVARYLDLLEKVFIIRRLSGFRRNLRTEVTKTSRYYFIDNGVRNILINNLNQLSDRSDVGELWENYLYVERLKKREYKKIYANEYFWRTHAQNEVDLVEERNGKLHGFEFKWGKKYSKKYRLFAETYNNANCSLINRDNYLDFIT